MYGDRLADVIGYNWQTKAGSRSLTPEQIRLWQSSGVFERFEAQAGTTFDTADEEPERINGLIVSPGLFSMLGVSPVRGRVFDDEDARTGAPPTVVISSPMWQSRFAGASDVIGRHIILNDRVYTVIGVMPKRFQLRNEQLWVPLDLSSSDPALNNFMGLARLPPHSELAAVQKHANDFASTLPSPGPGRSAGPFA